MRQLSRSGCKVQRLQAPFRWVLPFMWKGPSRKMTPLMPMPRLKATPRSLSRLPQCKQRKNTRDPLAQVADFKQVVAFPESVAGTVETLLQVAPRSQYITEACLLSTISGFGNEPEGDSLKRTLQVMVFLDIPFPIRLSNQQYTHFVKASQVWWHSLIPEPARIRPWVKIP